MLRAPLVLDGNGDRVLRKTVQKICRAVQWVDHPDELIITTTLTRFLGENTVMWIRLGDDVDNDRFGLAIHGRDKVVYPFGVYLESVDSVRLSYDDASCRTSRAYGDVEQSMQCSSPGGAERLIASTL